MVSVGGDWLAVDGGDGLWVGCVGVGFLVLGEGTCFWVKGGEVGLLVLFGGVPASVGHGGGGWMH